MASARTPLILWIIILINIIFSLSFPAYAKYGGGTGEPNDPYQVATAEDLMLLGNSPDDYDKNYILTADIDLDPNLPGRKIFDKAMIGVDWRNFFAGSFNGNGHTISHLTIRGESNLGLFGRLSPGAIVSNLQLEAVDVNGTGERIGGLVGFNHGIVTECQVTGTVSGTQYVGGLAGDNYFSGSITMSCSMGMVSGNQDVGGLVGHNYDSGRIAGSYSTSSVIGSDNVGGLVGRNVGSITTSCYNMGTVSGREDVGGLVGTNMGNIIASYSTGAVSGDYDVGGFVGNNFCNVATSYSTGVVSGNHYVGGLVGMNWDSVATSYSTGMVNGTYCVGGLVGSNPGSVATSYSIGIVSGNESVGGLIGGSSGSIVESFWDMETSGRTNSSGGTRLTTAKMQNINTFLNAGWDCVDEIFNGTCDYWQMSQDDYPKLRYLAGDNPIMPEGLGTAEEPYLIRDARDLGTIWFEPFAHYRLEKSIDLSGIMWSMAVIPWFGGVFDGNGCVISNLHVQGGGYLGLFGQLRSGGIISNLGLEAININGTGDYIGGLVGHNQFSSITRSYSTGIVSGKSNVGGLVGFIYSDGSITASYSNSSVNGDREIGGLVGKNQASRITTSYSTGSVSGDYNVGGLVGENYHGDIYSSVWDIQTSGIAGSDGGVGLTTAEMMNPNIFGLNGFTNDPNWILNTGIDYPRLAWEGTPGDIILEQIIDWMQGQGTAQNPYRIYTADQLILLGKASILWDKSFVLGADIDLDSNLPDGKIFGQAIIPQFTGVFNGKNHVISNLVIKGDSHLGLFGQVENRAVVKNLGVVDVDVDGSGSSIGSLAGRNEGDISNCYSTGIVSGDQTVGGLVGSNHNYGNITQSYSTGTVSGTHFAGGLTGGNGGSITMSYSISVVAGDWDVGGLVAINSGNITNSYSIGSVSGNYVVGGLVGGNHTNAIITRSCSIGTVSGNGYVGGLVGENWTDAAITQSYSMGQFSGSYSVGGLAGSNGGIIATSYNAGTVAGDRSVGGLVGYNWNNGSVTLCFWDVETGGLTNMCGSQVDDATICDDSFGKTTTEMQAVGTFLEAGWDFEDETENGTEDIWWIEEGRDYPHLWWEKIPEN